MGIDKGFAAQDSFDRLGYDDLESQNYSFRYTTPSHAQLFQAGGLNILQHQCAQGHELPRQDSNTVERVLMRNAFSRDFLNHGAQARTAPGDPTSMSLDQAGALPTSTSTSALRRVE
jgi:hypothetical protein